MRAGFPIATKGMVIGLLGGSFDPAHEGHVHITREALKRMGLDRVWWLVSPGNPLKARQPAPMAARLRQARRVMDDPVSYTHLDVYKRQAQTFAVGNDDLRGRCAFQHGLPGHFVIACNPGLALGLPGLGAGTDPFQFLFQGFLFGFVLARLLLHALGFLFQPGGIVALVRNATATVEFQNPARDVIQEIAVVGDDQDGALVGCLLYTSRCV